MHGIDETLKLIQAAHGKLNTAELARRANVPYMTVRDAAKRGFSSHGVETLRKLEAAAKEWAERPDGEAV